MIVGHPKLVSVGGKSLSGKDTEMHIKHTVTPGFQTNANGIFVEHIGMVYTPDEEVVATLGVIDSILAVGAGRSVDRYLHPAVRFFKNATPAER